jgi:hypothetical protein
VGRYLKLERLASPAAVVVGSSARGADSSYRRRPSPGRSDHARRFYVPGPVPVAGYPQRVGAPQGAVPAGGTVSLQAAGTGQVPVTGASAMVLNVTVTDPAAGGCLTVYGDGSSRPSVSNLNFVPGQTCRTWLWHR